jgi:hypothetical protein
MFKTPESRIALRAGFAAVLTGLSGLATALSDGGITAIEGVIIASAMVTAVGGWYGVGHQTPTEPFLGKAGDPPVEVPADRVTTTEV